MLLNPLNLYTWRWVSGKLNCENTIKSTDNWKLMNLAGIFHTRVYELKTGKRKINNNKRKLRQVEQVGVGSLYFSLSTWNIGCSDRCISFGMDLQSLPKGEMWSVIWCKCNCTALWMAVSSQNVNFLACSFFCLTRSYMYQINHPICPLAIQERQFFPLGYHFGSDSSSDYIVR